MMPQLPAPMLPELSSKKPSWIVAALAGAATLSETTKAAVAKRLVDIRCFMQRPPLPYY